jgi:DNA-binding MarR family transcriptional regulator
MGLLHRDRDVGFASARDALGLTDGNLATHARVLQQAGFVESRRVLLRSGFAVRYRITQEGADAFARYAAALRAFLPA